MGTARGGPPSQPSALKRLHGVAASRINESEPSAGSTRPVIPSFVVDREEEWAVEWREVWVRTTTEIEAAKYLFNIDFDALVAYVTCATDAARLMRMLMKSAPLERDPVTGGPKASAIRGEYHKAVEKMLRLGREFGLTPASRTTLRMDALTGSIEPAANEPDRLLA